MKFIRVIFDEISSRFLMVILGIMVSIVGLISPWRCLYALHHIKADFNKNLKKTCDSC